MRRRLLHVAAVVACGLALTPGVAAQEDRAQAALARLTPAQRVGQLFLVAFYIPQEYYEGDAPDPLKDVRRLVQAHGVGGVVLQKGNNVFRNERGRDLPREIAVLTAELQTEALTPPGPGVPLLVAVDHEGDGDPLTHLREGFTPLPSAMAIGATYNPDHARACGRIAGRELAAVGVNLLLGPVLDVLAEPRIDSGGDIGTRAFAGDPYWVRRLGTAYVEGVHQGSDGRVATVAKHFPGHGGSDRSTDDEVATVNRSLETLRDIELQPFAAVTAGSPGDPDAPGVTDALMTSHIRYRAIQADVRRVTPPISFDHDALATLLGMEGFPFAAWRDGGGLIVADSLGVRAVRRWFNPAEDAFPNRQIARQALVAGNDLLILAQFAVQPGWANMLANIEDTLDYFVGQYGADPVFRARVDDAAVRVLRRKVALYARWTPEDVVVDAGDAAAVVGSRESADIVARVARDAVTSLRGLDRPQAGDRILIVSDYDRAEPSTRLACVRESCGLTPERWQRLSGLGLTLVEQTLTDRFGPGGSGIVAPGDVASATFCQLRALYSPVAEPTVTSAPTPGSGPSVTAGVTCDPPADPAALHALLRDADWIVFAFADLDPTEVRDLRGLLLPQVNATVQSSGRTRLGVLSFGPPYYVDQTNFFHLDLFLTAYSKIPSSIEAAVDALYGELEPVGSLPVSYDDADLLLPDQLAPDPLQSLAMRLASPDDAGAIRVPAQVAIEIGPVYDHHGHTVPDGTAFVLTADPAATFGGTDTHEARTVGGIARVEVPILTGGRVTLSARSDNAVAAPLVLDVPVPTPSATGEPTSEPAPSGATPPHGRLGLVDLALAALGVVVASVVGDAWFARPARDRRVQRALLVTCGGLGAYVAYAIAVRAGLDAVRARVLPGLDSLAVTLAGALLGLGVGVVVRRRRLSGPGSTLPPRAPV
jgi:beta-N-acetylhexosaminidase